MDNIFASINLCSVLCQVRPRRVFTDGTSRLRSYSLGHALCGQILKQLPGVSNVHVVISLDPIKPNLTVWDIVRRKLKLASSADGHQDFLGLGARKFALFIKRQLLWHINNSDVISVDVIAVNPKRISKASEMQRQKTRKGIQWTWIRSRQPKKSLSAEIVSMRVGGTLLFNRGNTTGKPRRLVRANSRQKRQAQQLANKQRQKMHGEIDYYVRFIVVDRVMLAAQQVFSSFAATSKAEHNNGFRHEGSHRLTPALSKKQLLKGFSTAFMMEHQQEEKLADSNSEEDIEIEEDEEELERKETQHPFSPEVVVPQQLEHGVSRLVTSRWGSAHQEGGRPSLKVSRLVKCPDKFTAFEVFAFMSNHLQGDLNASRKTFPRTSTAVSRADTN